MRSSPRRGFALFEVVVGLVLIGFAAVAWLDGARVATRAVRDGRWFTEMAALGTTVLHDIERAYRFGAPSCTAPSAGTRSGRGVTATWSVADAGSSIDLTLELRQSARASSVDTVLTRIACR